MNPQKHNRVITGKSKLKSTLKRITVLLSLKGPVVPHVCAIEEDNPEPGGPRHG